MTTPRFEDVWPTVPGNGWLAEDEARLLWDSALAADPALPILEVGCYKGRSTCLLAALGRTLYCVDPFSNFDDADPSGETILKEWRANVTGRGYLVYDWDPAEEVVASVRPYCLLFRQRVEDWTAPSPVGFAYLDGDHTREGTAAQLRAAARAGAALACVHDYADSGGGLLVRRGVADAGGTVERLVRTMALVRLKA